MQFNRKYFLSCLLTLACFAGSHAQQSKIDSLKNLLATSKEDTSKVILLIRLSFVNIHSDLLQSIKYAEDGLILAKQLNYSKGIARLYNTKGSIELVRGNYEKALENYHLSMQVAEKLQDRISIASCLNNLGNINYYQGNFDKTIEFYSKALAVYEDLANKGEQARCINNIGSVYAEKGEHDKAIDFFNRSLKIDMEIGNINGEQTGLNNLGQAYADKGNEAKAFEYFMKSLTISKNTNNKKGFVVNNKCLARLYLKNNNLPDAKQCAKVSLDSAIEMESKEDIKEAYKILSEISFMEHDYKKAFEYQAQYMQVKDSLLDEESQENLNRMQLLYETEKKDKEIQLLNKDKALKESEIQNQKAETERQTTLRNTFIAGFALVLVLAFFIFRGYRQKKKANLILEEKNNIIEEKNKNISDSINYARRIQEAILPAKEIKYKIFPDAFVLFQPKDVVSGDFYWFTEKNGKRLIAAVDCTGHGIPGAFMSMIGNAFLNEIVNEKGITVPSEVLSLLRHMVIKSLKQTDAEDATRDGMDIALLCFDDKKNAVEYAGANNPLWHITNNTCNEYKPDKRPIGYFTGHGLPFTNHTIEAKKGDAYYIFTDGFADQFGGDYGKKFKNKQLQELLLSIQQEPMQRQEEILLDTFNKWKGNLEQVDDLLVIGIRA